MIQVAIRFVRSRTRNRNGAASKLLRKIHSDERGMTLVFVGLGFMSFLAATMLAVDVGMLMTARSQAQNSADAGALGGAVTLAFGDYNDRAQSGQAVQTAVTIARSNAVMGDTVAVTPADVAFLNDASGQPNRVKIDVFRTTDRGNPVANLIASVFGTPTSDISATATAEITRANASRCVKPWAIPDKWTERQTPAWDTNDTFNAFPGGSLLPDIFRNISDPLYTGYNWQTARGLQLRLIPVTTNTIKPGMYFPLRLPGSNGSNDYRENISLCDGTTMHFGDGLTAEPAATPGDTTFGVSELIAQDPGAYWDSAKSRVVSTRSPSPRVVVVPVYDPLYFNQGKIAGNFTQIRISNMVGFFIEDLIGNDVLGRIVPVSALIDNTAAPAPTGSFPRVVRLVE